MLTLYNKVPKHELTVKILIKHILTLVNVNLNNLSVNII